MYNWQPFQGLGFGNNGGFQVSFGIGAFPFTFLTGVRHHYFLEFW